MYALSDRTLSSLEWDAVAGCEPPVLPDRSSPLSTTTEHESQGSPEQVYRKLGWLPPPFPPNETERLKALYRYGILSRDPDNPGGMDRNPTLNKIVRMAQKSVNFLSLFLSSVIRTPN